MFDIIGIDALCKIKKIFLNKNSLLTKNNTTLLPFIIVEKGKNNLQQRDHNLHYHYNRI